MPTYDYVCPHCVATLERNVKIAVRDEQSCLICGSGLQRLLSRALFRFKGQVTKGGGADGLTAAALGIPVNELPSGLRTKQD